MGRKISYKCKRCGTNNTASKESSFVLDKKGNFICPKCIKRDWHLQVSLGIKPKTYSAFIPFSKIEKRVLSNLTGSEVDKLKQGEIIN